MLPIERTSKLSSDVYTLSLTPCLVSACAGDWCESHDSSVSMKYSSNNTCAHVRHITFKRLSQTLTSLVYLFRRYGRHVRAMQ